MKPRLLAVTVSVISGLIVVPAAAVPFTVNYQLDNVRFNDGGTAFGTISAVYDANSYNIFSQLLSVDITTTAGSILAGTHYTSTNLAAGTASGSSVFGQPSLFLTLAFAQVSTADQANFLYLQYDEGIPVTPTGTLQLYGTYQIPGEWHNATTRAMVSGSLVPFEVPEPATWMIFLGGLGLGYAGLRRRTASALQP
jgi:hypothetical protein